MASRSGGGSRRQSSKGSRKQPDAMQAGTAVVIGDASLALQSDTGAPKPTVARSAARSDQLNENRPPSELNELYNRGPRSRRAGIGGLAVSNITVLGIEVCQAIQDICNSVSLIANKPTVVRVYLKRAAGIGNELRIAGELRWRRAPTAPAAPVPSVGPIDFSSSGPSLIDDQRQEIGASLNFMLPSTALSAGDLSLEIVRLTVLGGTDVTISGNTTTEVHLRSAPPLRVRVIGLRYSDPVTGMHHEPSAVHFAHFRSYLKRAYPVAEVVWSQIVVDADFAPPFNSMTPVLANAQIAAIRDSDVSAGLDPRTHYYGLVDDANGLHFMRGQASGIPQTPRPDSVASGPCGVPNGFAGDQDSSYADWYGAHELGHTFGRFHPGFPTGQQDASDPGFPYDNGQLSNADRRYMGFDVGDPALGIAMRALPGTTHHDVMTYADRQWLSAHTYEAVRARLMDEDKLFAVVEPIA